MNPSDTHGASDDSHDRNERRDPYARREHRRAPAVGGSRFVFLLAFAGTVISAFAMLVFGLLAVLSTVWHAFRNGDFDVHNAKHLAVDLIEMTDLFLLGMVLYVVGMGMYQLFIDANTPVPAWMRVRSLTALKTQLINVIILLLAVSFLAEAVSWESEQEILYFGISIAAIILSVAAYNLIHHRMEHGNEDSHAE